MAVAAPAAARRRCRRPARAGEDGPGMRRSPAVRPGRLCRRRFFRGIVHFDKLWTGRRGLAPLPSAAVLVGSRVCPGFRGPSSVGGPPFARGASSVRPRPVPKSPKCTSRQKKLHADPAEPDPLGPGCASPRAMSAFPHVKGGNTPDGRPSCVQAPRRGLEAGHLPSPPRPAPPVGAPPGTSARCA